MNMKLLALTADRESVSGLLERISGALSAFSEEDTAFICCPTLKALLPQFAAALKTEECIVLGIDRAKYNAVRAKLCAAMALAVVQNEEIYALLSEYTGLSPEEKVKNAAVPENAVCFLSEDGMYPGLAVQKGAQTVVFLPLDEERLPRILKAGLVPYLMQSEVAVHAEKTGAADDALTESTSLEENSSAEDAEADVMHHTVNILRECGAKVAVSGTPYAEEIKKLGEGVADFDSFFVFTPHVEDKGDYNLTDYVALTAKAAKELSGAQLGASISDIGDGDGGEYICITVADDKTAVVRKLYREDDETRQDFVADAAEELVELIGEKAGGKGAVGIEVTGMDVPPETPSFLSKKTGKITLSVIVLLLVAAVTVGCIFFVKEKQARDAERATSTEAPTTTEPISVAEPEPEIETVVLSQFIYNEMRNGVQETPAEVVTQSAAGTAIDTSAQDGNTTEDIPSEIIVNGETLDAKEAVARMLEAEVAADTQPEALKAQAVAAYTYLKYRNTNWKITGVTLAPEYSDEVYNAVRAVFGEYLSFGGTAAFTPYFTLSAGRTTPADIVYGQNFPYLRAVDCATDKTKDGYKNELIFSADDMRAMLLAYDESLTLEEDPAQWVKVLKHDGAVNTGVGYVETISVGGKEISGIAFVEKVLAGKNVLSQCFSVTYNTPTNEFTVTAYGNGNGVGMSLAAADRMAATGSTYAQILSKFYVGAQLTA